MTIDLQTVSAGDELAVLTFSVSAEQVRAYLDATGEDPERWVDFVPPLAIGALALGELMRQTDGLEGALHTGQRFEFIAPVAPGEEVTARFTVASHARRRGALITAVDIELSCNGAAVAAGRTSLLFAPETSEAAE